MAVKNLVEKIANQVDGSSSDTKKYWWDIDANKTGGRTFWWDRDGDAADIIRNDIINGINTWIKNHNAYITNYQNRFANRTGSYDDAYVGDSADWLAVVTRQQGEFDQGAKDIINYLQKYQDLFDHKWINSVVKTLDSAGKQQGQIVTAATKDNEYWSSFGGAEAYNTQQRYYGYNKKYEGMDYNALEGALSNMADGEEKTWLASYTQNAKIEAMKTMDISAAENQIADLARFYFQALTIGLWYDLYTAGAANHLTAEENAYNLQVYNRFQSEYGGDTEKLRNDIQGRQAFLNQAKQVQESVRLAGVADPSSPNYDPEFLQFSGYVDNVSNPIIPDYKDLAYDAVNNNMDSYGYTLGVAWGDKLFGLGGLQGGEQERLEAIKYMNDDERSLYNYYYSKHGYDAAENYLDNIMETLNSRKATKSFEAFQGNTGLEYVFAIGAGLDNFATGIKNSFNTEDSYIPQSSTQILSGMVREDLADDGIPYYNFADGEWGNWNPSIFGNSVGQLGYDLLNTTANMAPSILTSAAVGLLNPTAGAVVGSTLMGVSSAGNAYQEALNLGYDKGQARAYSTLVGASEAGLQYLLGGVGKLGGKISGKAVTSIASKLDNVYARLAVKYGTNMLSEGFEEYLQEVLDPLFKNLALKTDEEINLISEDALYSFLLGAISSGFMEGTGISSENGKGVIGNLKDMSSNNQANIDAVNLYGSSTKELIQEGLLSDTKSESYKLAEQAQRKTDKGKTLTGYEIRQLVEANDVQISKEVAKENFDSVKSSAAKQLRELGETQNVAKIADLVAKRVTGQDLTRSEKSTLANSAYGAQVAKEMSEAIKQTESGKSSFSKPENTYKPVMERMDDKPTFSVSKTGETTLIDTDEAVSIAAVASIKDGSMTLKLEDGREVSTDEISFADGDEAELYSAIANIEHITPGDATVLVHNYDHSSKQAVYEYVNGVDEAYTYGYYNYSEADLNAGKFATSLTKEQMMSAYHLGKTARSQNINAHEATIKRMRTVAEAEAEKKAEATKKAQSKKEKIDKQKARFESDAEVYFMDGKTVTKFDEHTGKYDDKRMAAVNYAKFLSKLGIGGKYYFYKSYMADGVRVYKDANGNEVKAPNGIYKSGDGSIYIDLNAGDRGQGTTLFTLSHELTHFIKDWSKAKFKVLADFLIEEYGKTDMSMHKRVLEKQSELSKIRDKQVSYDEAFEEVVADSMSTMLTDGNLHEKLAKLRAQDKSLFNKIKQFFMDMIAKFQALYKDLAPEQQNARDVRAMKDSFDRIQQAFSEALVEASENFQMAEKNTTDDGGDVKMSVRDDFYSEVDIWDGKSDKTFIVGRTSDVLQSLGVKDSKVIWHSKKMARIMREHSGMTKDVIKQVPQILENPVVILASKQSDSRLVIFGTVTDTNGMPVTAILELQPTNKGGQILDMNVIASAYGKDNTKNLVESSDLVYVDPDKKRTKSWMQGLGLRLPSDTTTLGSIGKITYLDGKVKIESVPYGQYMQDSESAARNSDRDSTGKQLTKEQQEFFADSKVRDAKGNLLVVRHGTNNEFHIFDFTKSGKNGKAEGYGFYFSDDIEITGRYGEIQKEVYLNIKKPLYGNKRTIKKAELVKLVKALIDFNLEKYKSDGLVWQDSFISNYVYTYSHRVSMSYAVQEFVNQIWDYNTTDQDLVFEVAQADGRMYDSKTMMEFYDVLTKTIGYDGIIAEWSHADGKSNVYVTFSSEQSKYTSNKTPTSDPDMRYSERGAEKDQTDIHSRIFDMKEEVGKLQRTIGEVEKSAEFKAVNDRLSEAIRNDNIEEGIKQYQEWRESSGYAALVGKRDALRVELENLTKERDNLFANEAAEAEKAAVAKSGLSEADYFRKKAVKEFGYTPYFYDAGYITPNGQMLNFSGEKGKHFGSRGQDHRAIGIIYENTQGSAAMIRFMNDGNIRIMAETPGLDIASSAEPTKDQYATIKKFVRENGSKERFFAVDISDENGRVVGNYEYDGYVNADRVVNDIKYFFENGEVREQSSVARFLNSDRYSERTNAPVFYSQMGKVVEGMKQDKFGASSVISMLRGRGVKAEEIRWSGIQAFLDGKKSVTKAELIEFIQGSMLHVEEEHRVKNAHLDEFISEWRSLVNYYDEDSEIMVGVDSPNEMQAYLEELVGNGDLGQDEMDHLMELGQKAQGATEPTKWDDYKLDGGSNYRELLFKMPDSDFSNGAMRTHWGEYAQGILAHARIQDFNTFIGKMLFIEEIQSDWHNEGHQKGYVDESKRLTVGNTEMRHEGEWYNLYHNGKDLHQGVSETFLKNRFRNGITEAEIHEVLVAEYNKVAVERKNGVELVPDAPFKGNYHEFVLKRLLRMAAEEGYDSIGWTTADIQSQRWSDDYAEGYRIEYDQDIPKFLRKYGKQWGTTVGKTTLDNGTEVWSMAITDSMQKSVLEEGQAMYSERTDDSVSNRTLLANAFEGLAQNSNEYKLIQEYKDRIKLLNEQEAKLSKLNAEIREIRFGTTGTMDTARLAQLEAEAKNTAKAINRHDKKLLSLEASEPLRKVIERERKKEAQKTKDHVKEIQQNKKDRAEQTELRHKIRKAVRDLDKLLNRGNKKLNVKEDMKGFASKALELADYLFTDHISNDELIRKGIDADLVTASGKAQLVKETEEILTKLYDKADSLTDEEFARLDAKRKANEAKMKDLLTAQRNRRLDIPVYNLFNDLVTEYASLKNSKQDAVKVAYSEDVERLLRTFLGDADSDRAKALQNMRVADMTTMELWKLYNAYTMVLTTVRDANKFHVQGMTQTIEQVVGQIAGDFGSRKIPEKKLAIAVQKLANKIGWDYEKLYYALDRVGSEAFTELIMNLADSENTVMQDIIEAMLFRDQIVEKYGFNNWAVNKEIDREFMDNSGKKFKMTLGQMMSLYAYSRRDGAWDHIEYGGFVFGEAALTNPKPADSYKLSKAQCEAITNLLTKEQKGYVEEMQKFLSETMGAKGNEVSMKLYGIKMFGEKNYFPIHIAGQFKAQANESQAKAAAGFQSMSNAGFTHAQNPNAKAPFVLEGFNEIWTDHVNEMSRYHGTVPALEDLRRVMNRSTYSDSVAESQSIKQLMENHYGKEAVDYFDNLYREANSGAITDKLQKKSKKLLSLFRKNSVAYSLSVLIQQPASMVRAYAMIDKKYFGFKGFGAITSGVAKAVSNKWNKAYSNAYNEMLKYAPGVTMAKEIGGFDTATGGSIRSYLLDTKKGLKQKLKTGTALEKGKAVLGLVDDNAIANLPNVADKIAWIEIWNACKRETVAKHKDLTPNSEEFMQAVGERFTEVIRATQVYDSIFAKSPMLKSKNLAVQYLVSFMNEPNTAANMVEKAVRDATRGNWKSGAKTAAVVIYSIIFTNVLKSIVYAMRDDDEDETYTEKYIEAIVGGMMDDLNALNYIPIARDVVSLAQGYDVERADMAIVADAVDALNAVYKNATKNTDDMTEEDLAEFDKKVTEANWKLVESLASFFGIPVKNIRREIMGVIDHAGIASANAGKTTEQSAWDTIYEAVIDSLPDFLAPKTETKTDKLYEAIISGDTVYKDRLKSTYETDDAYNSAVRKALRENDPRIHDAAQARYAGNVEEYKRIFREIQNEGKFTFDEIMDAVNSELTAIKGKLKSGADSSEYSVADFVNAIIVGDTSTATAMMESIINFYVASGKTQKDAEESFANSVSSSTRKAFDDGLLDEAGAKNMLIEYAGEDEEEAAFKVSYWAFCKANPQYDLSESNVKDYWELAEPNNISLEVFVQFVNGTNGLETKYDEWGDVEVSKREQVLEVIDSLSLTWKQKDALYLAAGYSKSNIWDVPW